MATTQLGAVVRHIRSLAAYGKYSEQTDGALLRVFLSHNDQAAFEALVRRHGPMVLRVCRRTLGNVHDAEDALQATFLVLARQAISIRKRESLASWLHGVAYRMATHAKRAAARRHTHESRVRPTQARDPGLSAALQEIQVLLDEEIGRLPETVRGPFVYCCLENKSSAEAARLLSLHESTVWKRVSRARKLLQQRLARRGVSLTAALAVVALGASGASAAVPSSLVGTTGKAAALITAGQGLAGGPVSLRVVTLVQGVNQAMFLNKCKTAILLLLCTTIVGTGLGMAARHYAGAALPSPAQQAPEKAAREGSKKQQQQLAQASAKADAKDVVKVRGRVLDPAGKPLAGVKLYLGGHTSLKTPAYPVRATSGHDGNFTFTFAKADLQKSDPDDQVYQVLAVAENHGCAWATADMATPEVMTLQLVEDAPVSGRIVDTDGKPVAGATLTVTGVGRGQDPKDFDEFADLIRGGYFPRVFAFGWVGPLPGQPTVLTTGADGKFSLSGVGRDRVVGFRLEGRGIATDPVTAQGASFEYRAAVSRPIRGVVRDRATGSPLAGATLVWQFTYNKRYEIMPWRYRMATSDKNGHYELLGAPKSPQSLDRYSASYLAIRPAMGQPYLQQTVQVKDTPGLDPMTVDIDLMRGPIAVSGKITDKATGKPLAGAMVEYFPLHANPNAVKLPSLSWPRSEATTGPDGSYVLTVLPGQGVLGVLGPRPDAYMPAYLKPEEIKAFFKTPLFGKGDSLAWSLGGNGIDPFFFSGETDNALVLLEPGENEQTLVKDIALERAQELKGRVIGPDDEPLGGVTVWGLGGHDIETLKGAEFTVRRINPRAPRELVFHHKDKNFGFFLKELPTDKDRPLIVHLQPCGSAAGRILDRDGQPVANTGVAFAGVRQNTLRRDWQVGVTTDKEGRFRVDGLVPGMPYSLYCGPGSNLTNVWGEPGKCKDLGDLQLKSN